jgi:4a-hydroxytetrahydrobiopterin dehydratase
MAKSTKSKSGNSKSAQTSTDPVGAGGRMSDERVLAELNTFPEWSLVGDAIQRTFGFANFVQAMAFVNKVAEAAEADQHHPDVLIRYNKVTMTLSTHDAHGISAKDFALAAKMDAMV